ncbi:MAG: porin [Deltaproteobacteria bacterium]|nr:porin [Deltaproteobacteria bacterium]
MKKSKCIIAIAAAMFISSSAAYAEEVVHPPAPAGLDVHFGFPGVQGLNELLVKKGIITKEELEAQAKKHSMNISGYIQFQGSVIENNDVVSDEDGFRIRRAKLAVFGNAYEHVKFKLEANFAGTPALDDAFIEDDHLPYFVGRVGQFKVPFSLEELTSDTEILSIERSEVVKQIAPERDQGISFSGDIPGGLLSYSIGAFNGSKAKAATTYSIGSYNDAAKNATKNDNDQLLYAGRLVAKPAGWIKVGVNGLTSTDGSGSGEEDRTSYGIDLQIKNPKRGCSLQGEYLNQRLEKTGADVTSEGFYVQAGHFVVPKHLEVALKYEGYDADTAHRNRDDIRWTTVGLNFYIDGHDAKLMANYIFKNEGDDSYDNDTFLAQAQLRF